MSIQTAYDPRSQFNTDGAKYATTRWISEWGSNPYFKPIDPWYKDHCFAFSSAKLHNHTAVPMHAPGVKGWKGKFTFNEPTGLYLHCNRALYWTGTKANLFKMANFDVAAFDKTPGMQSTDLGNTAPLNFVAMLNGCFSGIPRDEAGNKPDNYELIVMGDQVYGGAIAVLPASSITAWATTTSYSAGQKVTSNGYLWIAGSTATSGASAPTPPASPIYGTSTSSDGTITWTLINLAAWQAPKLVNPSKPDLLSSKTWTTAFENFAITPDNIVLAIVNLQLRRAMNGIQLGLATKAKCTMFIPYESYEQTRQIVEVFRQIPGTGVTGSIPKQVPITGGSGLSQVVYSVQDNPAFGRCDLVAVPGMASTRWAIAAAAPPDMAPANRVLLVHAQGGKVGEWQIQDDPQALGGDTVPHISVFQWAAGTQSPMFSGAMEGTESGDIGIGMMLAEGYATGTPILWQFCDTGYFS